MTEKQYPELPTHFMLVQESFRDEVYLYTADQMRAYVDADRAMRATKAAQHERVPLTDVKINKYLPLGVAGYSALIGDDEIRAFARAVEATHGIKPAMTKIDENQIVQAAPHIETFGGCMVVVTEVKEWGIQGYVQSAGVPGRQYISLKTGDFEATGGRAVWVAQ